MPVSPKTIAATKSNSAPPRLATRDFLNTFFYYNWTAASAILVMVGLGCLVAILVPASYKAEARLLTLYAGYYNMQLDQAGGRAAGLPGFETTQIVSVEAQILSSPELHRAIVQEELGPFPDEAALDRAVQRFERHLSIEKVETANVIELSYSDSDPVRAAHTLDKLIQRYFRQRAGVFTEGRVSFLVEHRDKVRAQLDKANAELIAFQKSHDVVDIDSQVNSAVTLHALLVQRSLENETSLTQDSSTLDSLKKEAKTVPERIELFEDNTEAAHALDTMQLTLLQLQARRADLMARYMEESPFVAQIDDQIAAVTKDIDRQKSQVVTAVRHGHNSYYDTVQDRIVRLTSDVAGEQARKQTLEEQIKDSDKRVQFLIATANQLHRMEIDRDLLAESFKSFSREVEQARIQQNQADTSSSTNVRIIQAPVPPTQRSNPPILFVAASLVAGIMTAGISVLARTSLRETFLSPEEIERSLGLPVLSAPIHPAKAPPPVVREVGQRFGALRTWLDRRLGRGRDEIPPRSDPPPARKPHAELGRMVSAINNSAEPDVVSRVSLLLSFRGDDGVDGVTQSLVEELERRSTRPVLVLDLTAGGDLFGQPDADGLLHWPDDKGLGPSWRGAAQRPASSAEATEIFSFNAVEHRYIVVGRRRPGAFLPAGRQSSALFDSLRREHDYIVLRVPPVSQSFAGIEWAILADATVLAIRAEATRKPVALSMKSQILDTGGRIVGVAMTHRHSYIPSFVYRFL
jgi:uncharacterized protein involved in exopolysaccharide biosynthesis